MKNELLKINGGLDLPIAGKPNQVISSICDSKKIGIIGADYRGLKPTMAVREGDRVKKGQILFSDKKNELTKIVSPISGKVSQINRGARRVLQSVVIDCEGDEEICFEKFTELSIENADREKIRNILSRNLRVSLKVDFSNSQLEVNIMTTTQMSLEHYKPV